MFAAIALLNSKLLYRDAQTLFEQASFGIARSLAISAREECGKVFIACAYLGEVLTPEEFVAQLRDHKPKQAEGLIPGAVLEGILNSEAELRKLMETNHPTTDELVGKFAAHLTLDPDALTNLLKPLLPTLRADHAAASAGNHESERQAGVYVTMNAHDGALRIEHPFQITKEQCESELSRLRMLLDDHIPANAHWLIADLREASEPSSLNGLAQLVNETFTPALKVFSKGAEADG